MLIVVVLVIAAMAALPRLVPTARVQSLIAAGASQALARPVKLRSVSLSVWPVPSVRLHGFEVAEDPGFGGGPFVRLDRADLRLKLWPLLRGHVEFATLVLAEPTITIVHGPGTRWNFSSLGAARESATVSRAPRAGGPGGGAAPLVSRIVIHKGVVTYERRTAGGLLVRQRLQDLEATLTPRAGALTFAGSARVMPGALSVKVSDGTLGPGGARALTDAALRARIEFEGRDVGPAVAAALGPEPAVGGVVTGRFEATGTLGHPRATGRIELKEATVSRTMPACPEPRKRTLALSTLTADVSWLDGRLVVEPLVSGIGQGRVTTRLSATPATVAKAELSDLLVERIPLDRVLVDFLCHAYAVTGPLDLTGSLSLSARDVLGTLSGSGRFRVGAGKVVGPRALALFGGLVRVTGAASSEPSLDAPRSVLAFPLEFDSIVGSYQIAGGVLSTRDLTYTSRAVTARVRGDYALPSARLDADVVLEHGRDVVQAKVSGSVESPSIRMTPSIARGAPERFERGFRELLQKFR